MMDSMPLLRVRLAYFALKYLGLTPPLIADTIRNGACITLTTARVKHVLQTRSQVIDTPLLSAIRTTIPLSIFVITTTQRVHELYRQLDLDSGDESIV